MQRDKNLIPRSRVRSVLLLFGAFWLVLLCLGLALASREPLTNLALAAFTTPIPPTVTRFAAPTSTLPPWPTAIAPTVTQARPAASAPPSATALPSATETATIEPSPTTIPSPTRFYIITPHPTALPTPDLPPAAPFPTTCDGPG